MFSLLYVIVSKEPCLGLKRVWTTSNSKSQLGPADFIPFIQTKEQELLEACM